MIKFGFDSFNIVSQLENPIICSFFLTCIFLLLTFLLFDTDMINLAYYGIAIWIISFGLLHFHYKQLKLKFSKETMDSNTKEVMTKALDYQNI